MNEDTGTPTPETENTPAPAAEPTPSGGNFAVDDLPAIDPVQQSEPGTPEPEAYTLAIDPAHQIEAETADYMTQQARELGLPSDGISSFINNVLGNLAAAEKKGREEAVKALRAEWGADFNARAKATKEFTDKVGQAVGLTEVDAAFLSSPSGYRLMYGLSKMFGEGKAASGAAEQPLSAEQKRAMAIDMRDNRANPYHKLLHEPGILRSERVVAWKRFNELYGKQIYPEQ